MAEHVSMPPGNLYGGSPVGHNQAQSFGGIAAERQSGRTSALAADEDTPRLVTRGETHTDPERFRISSSVRVNLSVPARLDELLSFLSQRTGHSKASFVMEALNWYLPRLEELAVQFGRSVAAEVTQTPAISPPPMVKATAKAPHLAAQTESRADRRRREKELRKLAKRNHGNGANGR